MIKKIFPEILIQEGVQLFDINKSGYKLATIELVPTIELMKQIRIVAVQSMFAILDQMGYGDKYDPDTFSRKDFDNFIREDYDIAKHVCNSINEIDLYFKFYHPGKYKEEIVKQYLYNELYKRYIDTLPKGYKYYVRYAPDKYTEIDITKVSNTATRVEMAKRLNKGLHSGKIISSKTNPNKPKKGMGNIYDKFLNDSLFNTGFGGLIIPTDLHIDAEGNAPMTNFLEAFISPHEINEILKIAGFGIEKIPSEEEPVSLFSVLDEMPKEYEYDTENGAVKIDTLGKRENLLIELKHIFTTDFPGALNTYEEIKHKSTDQLEVIYNTLKGDK